MDEHLSDRSGLSGDAMSESDAPNILAIIDVRIACRWTRPKDGSRDRSAASVRLDDPERQRRRDHLLRSADGLDDRGDDLPPTCRARPSAGSRDATVDARRSGPETVRMRPTGGLGDRGDDRSAAFCRP
ncbi:MAG: hypothetical protein B7X09_01055 [Acidiphilium sp. 21-66-27]|nr:MAG: hypothetical protein B7X09_01055 [Acidiphilium sp. 21-66-27]